MIVNNRILQIKTLLELFVPREIANKILFECRGFITSSARAMKPLISTIQDNQLSVSIISPRLYAVYVEEQKKKKMRFFARDEDYMLKFMYDNNNVFMSNV